MLHLGSYRWVVFDAVGTLIHPHPPVAAAYHAVASRYGSRLSVDEIGARFKSAFRDSEGAADGCVTSEAIERDRWRKIVAAVIDDAGDHNAAFEELFTHFAAVTSWRTFPDVAETLAGLRQRGLRLAIGSNFDARLHNLCAGIPDLRCVERRIVSSEVGYRKPSPQFFTALLDALECPPAEVLMIGDDLENDILAAQEAGLSALLIRRASAVGGPKQAASATGALGDLRELISAGR